MGKSSLELVVSQSWIQIRVGNPTAPMVTMAMESVNQPVGDLTLVIEMTPGQTKVLVNKLTDALGLPRHPVIEAIGDTATPPEGK